MRVKEKEELEFAVLSIRRDKDALQKKAEEAEDEIDAL